MGDDRTQTEPEIDPATMQAASCPRCGYDLQGARAAWKESCPLTGVCSECGYGFEWADVLIDQRRRINQLYEHVAGWWRIDAALRTLALALTPRRYWRVYQPHAEVTTRRLLLWPIVIWGATLVFCALFTLTVFGGLALAFGTWPTQWTRAGVPFATPISLQYAWAAYQGMLPLRAFQYPFGGFGEVGVTPAAQALMMCLVFNASAAGVCVIGRSHRKATRVRGLHILRVASIGTAPAVAHLLLSASVWVWLHVPPATSIISGGARGSSGFPWSPPDWLHELYRYRSSYWDDLFVLAWLFWWWWSALRLGLRLRNPLIVWAFSMAIGTLVCLLLGLRTTLAITLLA